MSDENIKTQPEKSDNIKIPPKKRDRDTIIPPTKYSWS